jgi:hypothetical protein
MQNLKTSEKKNNGMRVKTHIKAGPGAPGSAGGDSRMMPARSR